MELVRATLDFLERNGLPTGGIGMATLPQTHIGTERPSYDRAYCSADLLKRTAARHSMGRREFITLIGSSALYWPFFAHAQQPQPKPMKRIGVLWPLQCLSLERWWADHDYLKELGWISGQNYIIECVSALDRLDQLPALARDLVSRHPDVLVAIPNTFIKALKQETTTIPIVMLHTSDPVETGLVTNLARPEGNVTGVASFGPELITKRVQLLKEIFPKLRRLAFIVRVPDPEYIKIYENNVTIAASRLGFVWQRFRPVVATDYDEIFSHIAAEHFDAAYIQADPLSSRPENVTRISQLALRYLVPAISDDINQARAGLLLTYNPDWHQGTAPAMRQIDKLLRGAKPSELPVEQQSYFQLKVNLKTAKALGLVVPPTLLALADEVIE